MSGPTPNPTACKGLPGHPGEIRRNPAPLGERTQTPQEVGKGLWTWDSPPSWSHHLGGGWVEGEGWVEDSLGHRRSQQGWGQVPPQEAKQEWGHWGIGELRAGSAEASPSCLLWPGLGRNAPIYEKPWGFPSFSRLQPGGFLRPDWVTVREVLKSLHTHHFPGTLSSPPVSSCPE